MKDAQIRQQVFQLLEQGQSLCSISNKLKISHPTIYRWKKLGISTKKPGRPKTTISNELEIYFTIFSNPQITNDELTEKIDGMGRTTIAKYAKVAREYLKM